MASPGTGTRRLVEGCVCAVHVLTLEAPWPQEALEKELLLSKLMTRRWESRPPAVLAAAMGLDVTRMRLYMAMLHRTINDTGNPKHSFTAHIARIISEVRSRLGTREATHKRACRYPARTQGAIIPYIYTRLWGTGGTTVWTCQAGGMRADTCCGSQSMLPTLS